MDVFTPSQTLCFKAVGQRRKRHNSLPQLLVVSLALVEVVCHRRVSCFIIVTLVKCFPNESDNRDSWLTNCRENQPGRCSHIRNLVCCVQLKVPLVVKCGSAFYGSVSPAPPPSPALPEELCRDKGQKSVKNLWDSRYWMCFWRQSHFFSSSSPSSKFHVCIHRAINRSSTCVNLGEVSLKWLNYWWCIASGN